MSDERESKSGLKPTSRTRIHPIGQTTRSLARRASLPGKLGKIWSTTPVQLNQGATVGKSNVFPWVAADANGHGVVVWFGANLAGNSNNTTVMERTCSDGTNSRWAQWNVYMAESVNGHLHLRNSRNSLPATTLFTRGRSQPEEPSAAPNRNLLDFFQVALDPQHRAHIAFADDHLASTVCSTQSPGHCASVPTGCALFHLSAQAESEYPDDWEVHGRKLKHTRK
jgi:hypothetical protein